MKVFGFAGWSGSGKTTLIEQLVPRFNRRGACGVAGQARPPQLRRRPAGQGLVPPPRSRLQARCWSARRDRWVLHARAARRAGAGVRGADPAPVAVRSAAGRRATSTLADPEAGGLPRGERQAAAAPEGSAHRRHRCRRAARDEAAAVRARRVRRDRRVHSCAKRAEAMNNGLLSVDEALGRLLAGARPVNGTEKVPTLAATGRVLAQAQTSTLDVPPLDNSAMDGYAVRSADCVSGAARLRIAQRIPAGAVGRPLEPGTAARIFTGAPDPAGRGRRRDAGADGRRGRSRRRQAGAEAGRMDPAGRRATSARGATILAAGMRLRPQEAGLAASVGIAQLPVYRKVRAALFFTGDELVMPGEPLAAGRDLQLEPLHAAPACPDARLRDRGSTASCPTPSPRRARCCGAPRRRATSSSRRAASRWATRTTSSRRWRPKGKLRSVAHRDEAGPAARVRRGAARRRWRSKLHRPARQPGVELRDLPDLRPAVRAAAAGRDRGRAARASRCAPISTGRSPTRGASSCA